ncbi:ATP synthase, F1 delta subunit [Corynebacterium mustelae]|uniref:ATP synthase subunit delta n=1 Tax=Corynebacterium mustelae TaxID=571915 RepID=A0A0G3GWV5_9CORY|nr:F0F1 ATP synthase subunit delta [Corynebacterium mustelae]AKK05616.1 ATP synthase, F1 delta subunit [Corynebacterium mustelae]
MHAASRDALAYVSEYLDKSLYESGNAVAVAAQTGSELFSIVDTLDGDRTLRIAVADSALKSEQRSGLVSAVFAGKVSQFTLELLIVAARQVWSTPREFRAGLVELGRRALLRSADKQGQLMQVEEELFQLSRLLDKEAQLTLRLDDRSADRAAKRDLLAKVLYGKVTAVTEALALQVIGRPENNAIDDIDALSKFAASLRDCEVAYVVSAAPLNDTQNQALATKLERIYGRAMSIHSEVDPSLLGGMVIRVGDELIDGSTSGKLERLRANLV